MNDDKQSVLYSLIGSRIRSLRKSEGTSQEELADKVGVSRTSIVNIEKGRQRLSIHLLWLIADTLNTDPGTLIPRRDELYEQPVSSEFSEKTLKTIDEKSEGDANTRKKLLKFADTNEF